MNTREQPQLMKAVLTVNEKLFLTPHYIRVVLESDAMNIYADARVGDNNKIIVPETKGGTVELPIFEKGRFVTPSGRRPLIRTYTMRSLDLENNLMAIDFVAHGEEGPASRWAINAEVGDELGVLMKVKSKPLYQLADWYVITGDHTALPVVSVILETLPSDAKGIAVIEVYGEEDILELEKPAGIEVRWKFNAHPGEESALVPFFNDLILQNPENSFIFAAAEYHAINEIQQILKNTPNLDRQSWRTSAYWKYGQAEDASSEERREVQS